MNLSFINNPISFAKGCLAVAAIAASTTSLFGQVNITNFTIDNTSVSFDIEGTIDLQFSNGNSKTPQFTHDTLYIWDKNGGNSGWTTSDSTPTPRVVTNNSDAGSSVFLTNASGGTSGSSNNSIQVFKATDFSNGNYIDASVSYGGLSFNLANIDVADLILSWGSDGVSASPQLTQIGDVYTGSAVPEPGSFALFLGLGALTCVSLRRRRS